MQTNKQTYIHTNKIDDITLRYSNYTTLNILNHITDVNAGVGLTSSMEPPCSSSQPAEEVQDKLPELQDSLRLMPIILRIQNHINKTNKTNRITRLQHAPAPKERPAHPG